MTSVEQRALQELYVPVRSIGAPECPFDAVVARGPDGRGVLLVDREALEGWPGWDVAASDHLLTPIDIARRPDGHDVILPLLGDRLDRLLARREQSATPLTDGERVTVAVSILRGLAAVVALGLAAELAQWWLTDDGRPTLVLGRGDTSARRASAGLLTTLASPTGSALDGVLAEAARLGADERAKAHELDAAEDTLFAVAPGEPVATEVMTTRRAAPLRSPASEPLSSEAPGRSVPWWRAFAFHLDAGLAETVAETAARMRRAFGRAGKGTRLPLFVAGGAAASVLAVGLLWPATAQEKSEPAPGAAASATADPAALPVVPPDAATGTGTPAPRGPVPEDIAPEVALGTLLDIRRGCPDDACRATVLEDPGTALSDGAVDADPRSRTVTFVDDLGGLAVLRVATEDGSAQEQFVTIVAVDGEWRVRDAYNVAHPPS